MIHGQVSVGMTMAKEIEVLVVSMRSVASNTTATTVAANCLNRSYGINLRWTRICFRYWSLIEQVQHMGDL